MASATKNNKTSRATATRTSRSAGRGKNLRDDRDKKYMFIIAALAVALISAMGVAVAAFSTDLKINGVATVKSTSWDVHFENLLAVKLTGTKAKEVTKPTIQDDTNGNKSTVIKEYKVELKDAGDAAEYTFDVKNAGDLDAKITAITINDGSTESKKLTCASGEDNKADTRNNNVCKNLTYSLTYVDGTKVAVGDKLPKATTGSTANVKTMKLKLELSKDITAAELPDKDVEVSGLGVTITYGQDESTE
jgi:hypothetical protein